MIVARIACLIFLAVAKVGTVECAVKTWKYDVNVENPRNWMGGAYADNCRGLVFPERLEDACMMGVRGVTVSEVVLPSDGDVFIQEGGYITLSERTDTCIKLKRVEYKRWNHPDSWNSPEINGATPDLERIPCRHDDVVFRKDATFAVIYPAASVATVNSVRIFGRDLSDGEWQDVLYPQAECNQFTAGEYGWSDNRIRVERKECGDRTGCVCHDAADDETARDVCVNVAASDNKKRRRSACASPVRPVGHCRDFCGGVLSVVPDDGFDLREFRKRLPEHESVEAYASKVSEGGKNWVQVVLADEAGEFRGDSVVKAEALHSMLKKDLEGWKIKSVSLRVSGFPHDPRALLRNVIFFVFGTLLAMAALFAMIFAVYVGPLRNHRFVAERLAFVNLQPATVGGADGSGGFAFARFKNKGDGDLSLASSVFSLDKEFDNPMYGRPVPSTSASTSLTEASAEEAVLKRGPATETTYENPLFFPEEAKRHEDDAEEE